MIFYKKTKFFEEIFLKYEKENFYGGGNCDNNAA